MAIAKLRAILASYILKIAPPQVPPGTSPSGPYVGDPADTPPPEFTPGEVIEIKTEGPYPGVFSAGQRYILCTCTSAEAEGHSVYITGRDAVNDCPAVAKCDPSNVAKMPALGQIVKLLGNGVCLVMIPGTGELVPGTALTVGAHYFVGSDALPCKAGDANQPAGGQVKQSIGLALTTKLILRVPGLPSAATW